MTDVWPCGLDLPRMRALLDAGQDVNEKMKGGATALCKAAYKNRSDAVALLLEYEAAPNSQCTNGDTALHYAMTYGDFDGVVELMVGAPRAEVGGLAQAGEVRILRGPPAADMADDPLARISGTRESSRAGISLAGGVDINADGWTEVLIGASGYDDAGSAFLLFGGYHP